MYTTAFNCRSTPTATAGRPRANVDVESMLRSTWTKIAAILGVSRATIHRRLEEVGISLDDNSHLSDKEVDELLLS